MPRASASSMCADERAAVHMAQAHAEVTGELGVALVTAGPAVTNAMTGIANAHVARAPVLVLSGTPPRAQENRGGLQDLDHTPPGALDHPLCAYRARGPRLCCRSWTRPLKGHSVGAAIRDPSIWIFRPTRSAAKFPLLCSSTNISGRKRRSPVEPPCGVLAEAVDLLWSARSGRSSSRGGGAKSCGARARRVSRPAWGDVSRYRRKSRHRSDDHPSVVSAIRGKVMAEARRRRNDRPGGSTSSSLTARRPYSDRQSSFVSPTPHRSS
ncbi:MAG: thiamine pyrophosphate-binding protein [Hyphomicrobium sp.]